MGTVLKAVGGVAAVGATCFAWGLAEAHMYTVREAFAPLLAPGSRDIRILHISDLHLMPRQSRKVRFIADLAALRPDLVGNTGDNISNAASLGPLMEAFGALRSIPGVFVFGSNDYHAPTFKNPLRYLSRRKREPRVKDLLPTSELRKRLQGLGWEDLTHRRVTMDVAGRRIAFRGTDDAHIDQDDYSTVAGPPDAADLNIAVTHAPYLRLLDAMAADRMDLILAGHTHGGQVCVPGYGALVTNCDLDARRVKGLSSHTSGAHTSALHVSAGLGTSPHAPYRFACRPEVTLLTLTART